MGCELDMESRTIILCKNGRHRSISVCNDHWFSCTSLLVEICFHTFFSHVVFSFTFCFFPFIAFIIINHNIFSQCLITKRTSKSKERSKTKNKRKKEKTKRTTTASYYSTKA